MKTKLVKFLLLVIFALGIAQTIISKTFVHPGIPFTKSDLDLLKENINREPWKSAYAAFANDSKSKLTYTMQGPKIEVGRSPDINRNQWQSDMVAIHNLAIMWYFTGNTAYAKKATDMLDLWATTNTLWSGNENCLDIGDYAQFWGTGADILRGTYPGWTETNTAHVKNYFAKVLYPTSGVPNPLCDHNKGAIQLKIALAAAAFCDDSIKWAQSIETYRMDVGGGLRCSYANGEVADAGRDDHWYGEADALVWGGEVAYKQGVDMFSELDKRLLAIGELYDHYAINSAGLSFIPIGGYSTYYFNWGLATGARHQGMMNNIIHGAYSVRKGIPTPWTDQMRILVGEGASSFLYYKSADTTSVEPLMPIPYATTEPDPYLTNIDIGATGIEGSASYQNGVWTVTGGGTSLASSLNYTFKPVNGNAAMIAKIESKSVAGAMAGLMIRESLETNAKYVTVNLPGTSGATSSASGPYVSNSTTHNGVSTPWWVKVERIGTHLFAYHSPDGINWSSNGIYFMDAPTGNYYIGLYSLSNNATQSNTTIFSNVSVTNSILAGAPIISSARQLNYKKNTPSSYSTIASGNPTKYKAVNLPIALSIDTISGLISGTPRTLGTYVVTITASNSQGQGTAVLVIKVSNNVAPTAITTISTAVVNTVKINVLWSPVTNATSYTVKRSLSPTGPFIAIQSGITGTNFVDNSPEPEVKNYYVVSAFAGDLESLNSNVVFSSVPPAVPNKPIIISSNGTLVLSWDAVPGAQSYKVKRSSVSGSSYLLVGTVTTNSFTDVAVKNLFPYYYIVSAMGATLESANSSEAFFVVGSTSLIWNSAPSNVLWTTANNWLEGIAPVSPAILTFNASTDTILTNDLNDLNVSGIIFNSAAVSSYQINGNGISLRNTLVNNSPAEHTLNIPMVIDTTLYVYTNTNAIYLPNKISGKGSLIKYGSDVLELWGANTYSGNTTIYGTSGGWPPHNAIGIKGTGTGVASSPTSGPIGTGKLILSGGSLYTPADATIYNDVEAVAGTSSYIYQTGGAMIFRGKITGSGNILDDGNNYGGIQLYGDNSEFTGKFSTLSRSGYTRCRLNVPQAGSAKAKWDFSNNGSDAATVTFTTGTISFGEFKGRSGIRGYGGSPVISIGALNTDATFSGYIQNTICVEKVGTGTATFDGNNSYTGTTTVKQGRFLLNNQMSAYFASPIFVNAGSFGGTGFTNASLTVGTLAGTGTGSYFEPGGVSTIGTFTSTSTSTFYSDATFKLEVNSTAGTSDKFIVTGLSLKNAKLVVTNLGSPAFALGTNLTIIDNTGTTAISGTFDGLPEMALVKIGTVNFRITYNGGTGNDVILLDERKLPANITSALTSTTNIGDAYSYSITAMNNATSFNATGLPSGLSINTTTGVISGTPITAGTYTVAVSATNSIGTGTANLVITVLTPAGVESVDLGKHWQVYPVQSRDYVHIVFGDASVVAQKIQLVDISGQIKQVDVIKNPNEFTLNISNLAAETYFLRVEFNGVWSTKKIIRL